MLGAILIFILSFAVSWVATKAVVGKIIKGDWWDITWWQAFLIVIIIMVIGMFAGVIMSPLALV